MKRNATPTIQKTPDNIRHMIRALIKLLMGEQDRTQEQPIPLKRHELALDMRDVEGHVLDAIYHCHDIGIAPTVHAVIAYLEFNRRLANPREVVEGIVKENEQEEFGLRFYSNVIHEWIKERQLKAVAEEIAAMADDPYIGYEEKYEAGMRMMAEVAPNSSFIQDDYDEVKFAKLVYEQNQESIASRRAGVSIGPELPFAAQKAFFSNFDWGEVTMIVGRRGDGKTTVASELGEHVSWNQKLKCDTYHISLETPMKVLANRQFSRYNLIPYDDVKTGSNNVDLSQGKYKKIWERWLENLKSRSDEYGHIKYAYSPMASVDDIITSMWRTSEVSRNLGRKVIFIVEHLHAINWRATHGRMSEWDALRSIFFMIAGASNKINQRVENHLFMFAQEGDTKGEMFGGQYGAMRSQYMFSMTRDRFGERQPDGTWPKAPDDLPITVMLPSGKKELEQFELRVKSGELEKKTDKEYYQLDIVGNRRYWYRKGDEYKHTGRLMFTKGNDGRPGSIELLCEMKMNLITQDPAQVADLRKQKLLAPENVA